MMYEYVAYTIDDGVIKGKLAAKTEGEVRDQLKQRGYKTLRIKKAFKVPGLETLMPGLYGVKVGELIFFSRQLATMLASGSNILRALDMIRSETKNKGFRRILAQILENVGEGESFTNALRQHPLAFDEVYVSLVEVGEYTGRLGPALQELADIMAQAHEAKQEAMKTMMMPLFLVGISALMLGFMAFVAFPPLLNTFNKMGVVIPLPTRILTGSVAAVVLYKIQLGAGLFAFIVIYKMMGRYPSTKYLLDKGKGMIPLVGGMIISNEMGRFSRVMATLLNAGVDLPSALRLARSTTSNEELKRAWAAADESLVSGHRMAEVFRDHKIIPSLFRELVSIGEESNTLPRTMTELADSYQKEFQSKITGILAVVEPVSQISVGGVVLMMMLSIIKPILGAADKLGG